MNPFLWKVKSFDKSCQRILLFGLFLGRSAIGADAAPGAIDLQEGLLDALPGVIILPHEFEEEIVPAVDQDIAAFLVSS